MMFLNFHGLSRKHFWAKNKAFLLRRQGDSKLAAEPLDGEVFVVLATFDGDLRR
jgi:hypothetical protein